MKILKWVVVILIAVVGSVFLYAQTLPDDFRVSRTIKINAPADKVFPFINDFKNFNLWNPFAKQDPTTKIIYSGSESGKGARFDWSSQGQAGRGSLEIVGNSPPTSISMLLHILTPMEAKNNVVFSIAPSGDTSEVSWTMTGKSHCVSKVFSLLFNMDKMVGGEFEKGLQDLKQLSEAV